MENTLHLVLNGEPNEKTSIDYIYLAVKIKLILPISHCTEYRHKYYLLHKRVIKIWVLTGHCSVFNHKSYLFLSMED